MDINKYVAIKKKLIDKALNRYLPASNVKPEIIHRAMRYAVFPGGKRIRPLFAIAGFEACGGRGTSIVPVACSMELLHCYTLVHDDMPCMDNDDFRRGKHTCHKKFGEDIALLAGDGLLTLAFEVIAESGNIVAVKEIAKTLGTRGTIGGQVADILAQGSRLKAQRKHIEYINLNKTATLFEVAVKSGGIIKGANRQETLALGNFGRDIGLAFQLLDDLKDKDGYVKLYGPCRTKEKAEALAENAKGYLKIFGRKADKLAQLSGLVLNNFTF